MSPQPAERARVPQRTTQLPPEAHTWLNQPALVRLWDEVHRRLERNGRTAIGRVRLANPTDAEREALSLLLGRPFRSRVISVELAEVDTVLRFSAADRGLLEVTEGLRGPVVDRRGQRDERAAAWEQTWSVATTSLASTRLAASEWAWAWLEEVRASGAVSRLGAQRAAQLLRQSIAVLAALSPGVTPLRNTPSRDSSSRANFSGRGELAERFTGTAHGLDDDTVLARLVLRGLAQVHGQKFPADPQGRRELWEAAGVCPDAVSTTVLTYALTPRDGTWLAELLQQRAAHHAETHLTLRDLRRTRWDMPPGTTVFVCENPRVVEAAADAGCPRPIVCTSGNPTHTVLVLLDALAEAGTTLVYRGDFDWPGIGIANRIITRYKARPWRMSAADYEQQVAQARSRGTPLQPLSDEPVPAVWDVELTATMQTFGVAVHEESALELLLGDLSA